MKLYHQKMGIFETGYYRVNRSGMILCGVWPEQPLIQAYLMRLFSWGGMLSILIPEYIYLYEVWGNIDDIIPCLPAQLSISVAFAKFLLLALNNIMVRTAVEQIRNDWKMVENTTAREVMHFYATKGHSTTVLYKNFMITACVLFVACTLMPMALDVVFPINETVRERIPPFETEYGSWQNDHFFLVAMHGAMTTSIVLLNLWTTDAFIMIMVQHCCGLFGIVGFTLRKLNSKNGEYLKRNELDIIYCAIGVHKRAISFADFIERNVTVMYAVVIFLNMLIISVTGVETIMRWDKKNEALRFAAFTIGQMVHLFFNTLPSQQLIDQSSSVFESIYDCEWNELSVKAQKLIWLMLVRSLKPNTITAGKFYQLNMENFSQVMQASISYFTVISSMR